MQVVILAGGKGTRLGTLTQNAPKPMLMVNKKPFLEHLLINLRKNGIRDIVLCIGYLSYKIKDHFKDGSNFGLKISYSVEDKLLGTGGALKRAENFLKRNFVLLNGDTYLAIGYAGLFSYFRKLNKKGLIVVCRAKNTRGNINLKGNLVVSYDKKSKNMKFTDAGVQFFRKDILNLIAADKFVSLEETIFPKLIKEKQLAACITTRKFYDMGTHKGLKIIRGILK